MIMRPIQSVRFAYLIQTWFLIVTETSRIYHLLLILHYLLTHTKHKLRAKYDTNNFDTNIYRERRDLNDSERDFV